MTEEGLQIRYSVQRAYKSNLVYNTIQKIKIQATHLQ